MHSVLVHYAGAAWDREDLWICCATERPIHVRLAERRDQRTASSSVLRSTRRAPLFVTRHCNTEALFEPAPRRKPVQERDGLLYVSMMGFLWGFNPRMWAMCSGLFPFFSFLPSRYERVPIV
jgi:hypothetical protein